MKGKASFSPFRVFGSPYTLALHQHITYLRLKQLPFKVYCTNFTTTLLYSIYYRARSAFCTVTPNGTSCLQLWQLAETVELDEDVEAIAQATKGDVAYTPAASNGAAAMTGSSSSAMTRTQRMLLSKETHPHLHLASWCVVVYACWWLAKTGAMYRYIKGESLDVLEGYVRYFFLGGVGFARLMAPRFREMVKTMTRATGVSEVTAPYMDEHFMRFCTALEAHLRAHPKEQFLLCTPHPTLADVTLGAAFSSYFLADDPPSSLLAERFPLVTEYAERVTGWRGSTFVGSTEDASPEDAADVPQPAGDNKSSDVIKKDTSVATHSATSTSSSSSCDYPDEVPESLAGFFELIAEVFPFLMSQCASFNAFMAGDGVRKLKLTPLEGPWKGCQGYLLPQLAPVRSLMIIDDNVNTQAIRSQDLEIAFMASREVHDASLQDFGRCDTNAEPPVSSATRLSPLTSTESATGKAGATPSGEGAAAVIAVVSESQLATTATDPPAASPTLPPLPASKFARQLDMKEIDPDDADFYRAFTTEGRRRLAGTASSLAEAVPTARHPTLASSQAMVPRVPVMEVLTTLRTMLAKMSCPQYTFNTVFHGRRVYVAVIPEHEVAKMRKARQETAAVAPAATSESAPLGSASA